MAERLSLADLAEHAGCRHTLEPAIKEAVRGWFTPARVTSLAAALGSAVPTVSWTPARVVRAVRAAVEDVL